MINTLWFSQNRLYWLLLPLSWLYGLITALRKKLYQLGFFKSYQSPVPIIVVGNLSVGGNGKTPIVIYLVEHLKAKGYKVGVVSRGYGGKSETYPLIVDQATQTNIAGDEPVLIYQRTQVPVAISPKRSDAVKALLDAYQLDLIITDDGLQHYALKRDIEIVVIDGKRIFGNGCLLPAGPMRESKNRLNSVDFIVINGSQSPQTIKEPHYLMRLEPSEAVNLLTKERLAVNQLKNVVAMAGIGDPERFFTTLAALNVDVKSKKAFADHYRYLPQDLLELTDHHQSLLMTEKDAVKCLSFSQDNWWYLPVDAYLPEPFLASLLLKIEQLTINHDE